MALNLFSRLMPPEKSFTSLFREQADCMVDAAEELRDMVGQREVAVEAHIASTSAPSRWQVADAVARQIFLAANRTFNAPIDREDILTLAHELDDVVDLIEDTAKGIQRYAASAISRRDADDGERGRRKRGTAQEGDALPRFDHARLSRNLRAVRAGRADRGTG